MSQARQSVLGLSTMLPRAVFLLREPSEDALPPFSPDVPAHSGPASASCVFAVPRRGNCFNLRGENGPLNQEQHQGLLSARCPLAMQNCSLSSPHLLINHICAPAMQTCPRPDYLLLNKCISVNQEACFNYLIEELLILALILNVRMFQKEKNICICY